MDLNEDFLSIQGIFLSLEKSSGSFKRIKHRGGNEATILKAITELKKFFCSKSYLKSNETNKVFDNQIKNIVLFLILNTELKKPLEQSGYEHLINIMPQLSTCVLANIVVGLDLSRYYCEALKPFSLEVTEELLVEMIPCLKKCKLKIHLANSHTFLELIIFKLADSTENEEKLTDLASQMLLNLTGLHGEQSQNIKMNSVYECMGYTMYNLLDLLSACDEKNQMLTPVIEKLLKTCCSVMMAVTIDVFCSWAEITLHGEVLQSLISEKSYHCIEKYQKYSPAKELIGMLGTIARKPKTVYELIQQADTATMISMVDKADCNQKLWIRALINTQVLKSKESIDCISRWAHLCTSEDVSRLLNLSVQTKDTEAKKLIIKCASTLQLDELIIVTTRYFYHNGVNHNLTEDVQPQIVLLFNKIGDKNASEEFRHDLHLLLLQNPEQTLSYVFAECLRNTFYLYSLKNVLPSIKETARVNDIGVTVLNKEIANNKPNEHNCKNYVELFSAFAEIHFYSMEVIVMVIVLPLLQNSFVGEDYELLKYGLCILNNLEANIFLKGETENLYNFLFDVMRSCRCKFLEFDIVKQEVVKECVGIIQKYCDINRDMSSYTGQLKHDDDLFVSFYKKTLFGKSSDTILKHLLPLAYENHAETVAYLIKVLPLCVTHEWREICSELVEVYGIAKTAEFLCDTHILLCTLINSQESQTEELNSMLKGLKYCLQNFGIVIKERIKPKIAGLEDDVALTKNICRLLKDMPQGNLQSEEGLSLASLLSDMSLRSLRTDKKFACLLISINESRISQMLAQKVLN